MKTKKCSKCKIEKNVTEFYKSSRDGYQYICKACKKGMQLTDAWKKYQIEYHRVHSKLPRVREQLKLSNFKYRRRLDIRIKNLARSFTNHAINAGKIIREPCADCGKEQSEAHHLDYNLPLLIAWLCADCHRKLHSSLKENNES